jgi:hypothetical protein
MMMADEKHYPVDFLSNLGWLIGGGTLFFGVLAFLIGAGCAGFQPAKEFEASDYVSWPINGLRMIVIGTIILLLADIRNLLRFAIQISLGASPGINTNPIQ